ncbi:MAG: hypothetical protein ABGW81_05905 [Paracoccaceae bacterium]
MPRTTLPVIVFDFGSARPPRRPRVMRIFGKLLGLFQAFKKILDIGVLETRPAVTAYFEPRSLTTPMC